MGKLWAGGVEMVVFNYYRVINKSKVQFDFYYDEDSTVEPPQDLIDMGARFYKVPPYQKLPGYIETLRKYFKENSYLNIMKLLTISIAAYNVERYLEKALTSFLSSSTVLDKLEVIIEDDGSTDGTFAIAQKYEKLYPDIFRAIHKENGGCGVFF